MQLNTATPENSYRIDHWHTGRCIRLHCVPAQAGDAPVIEAQPCAPDQATHFPSREAATVAAERFLPGAPVEIVRVVA
jgi:hypothetical protein